MTTSPPATSTPTEDTDRAATLSAVHLGLKACDAYGREDLGERLRRLAESLDRPDVRVVVVGEFKQGKSSLINALVNAQICPVDADIATAVPTALSYGETFEAVAVIADADAPDEPVQRHPISADEIISYATEWQGPPNQVIKGVEIRLPRKLLGRGLTMVDTPGVGGLGSAHSTAALGALSLADAVIFVSDASQEFTRTELDFLSQARDLCPNVVCVLTKTDFYPSWRRVLELDQGHLALAGIEATIVPVSSSLRQFALTHNDGPVNLESGFPELMRILTSDIVGRAAELARNEASSEVTQVADHLASQFEARRSALEDPAAAADLVKELERARDRAEQLRGGLARWSITLADGMADLMSEVEFDFRSRMKDVVSQADASIDAGDPIDTWPELEPWIMKLVSTEVVTNYRFLTERAATLGLEVAGHFAGSGVETTRGLEIHDPTQVLGRVLLDTDFEMKSVGIGGKGLTLMRNSYTGVMMFTMIGGMVSLGPMVMPIALGAGLVLGRKGLKDEAERLLTQRRTQARSAVRRYCDDVTFQVNKDSRDTLRRIQRTLRDHYTIRAEEAKRSTAEALKSAEDANRMGEAERERELQNVLAELERIALLRQRGADLKVADRATEVERAAGVGDA